MLAFPMPRNSFPGRHANALASVRVRLSLHQDVLVTYLVDADSLFGKLRTSKAQREQLHLQSHSALLDYCTKRRSIRAVLTLTFAQLADVTQYIHVLCFSRPP